MKNESLKLKVFQGGINWLSMPSGVLTTYCLERMKGFIDV